MVETENYFSKRGPINPNTPPTPKPPKGNPEHIKTPQIQNPNIKPHRQQERRPIKRK